MYDNIFELAMRSVNAEFQEMIKKSELTSLINQFKTIFEHIKGNEALNQLMEIQIDYSNITLDHHHDLTLPDIYQMLPNTFGSPDSLKPAFKLSLNPRDHVSVIIGIPIFKTNGNRKLETTLNSILNSLDPHESLDCLVILLVADTGLNFVNSLTKGIQTNFKGHLESGLLEVISPPMSYFPKFICDHLHTNDCQNGIEMSKKNLAYAFLMMYAQNRGLFYIHLKDDISCNLRPTLTSDHLWLICGLSQLPTQLLPLICGSFAL